MKKITLLLSALLVGINALLAQTPTYFNTNTAGGANTFPFNNSATSRKVQWFIPTGSLGSISPGNNITDVYFQLGSTASRTYPNFYVKLKQGTGTGLTGTAGGPIEQGMVVYFWAQNFTINSTTGGWLKITLQTPFLFNPSQPLVVEVEHDATSGTGPSVYQAVSIAGPGNGRQWADYNVNTITGVGTQQVNFGVDLMPAVPCTNTPVSNTLIPNMYSTCPGINNPTVSMAMTYTDGGLTYSWFTSTVSNVGPFTAVTGTASSYPSPTLGVTTWYQAVVTCTNTNQSTTLSPATFSVAGSTTNTVPYNENFESIYLPDRLPDCSWSSTVVGTALKTYTAAGNNNRVPNSGSRFASFVSNGTTPYVYTSPILLQAGVTYSAGMWYTTDLVGNTNWSNLTMLITPTPGLANSTLVAQVSGAVASPVYKALGNTFTVATTGLYHLGIGATSSAGTSNFLSFDDLSVTVPCSGSLNPVNVTINTPSTTICNGQTIVLNASGASTYTWNNASIGSSQSATPLVSTPFQVIGTNTLTGCTGTASLNISVKPSPNVNALAVPAVACQGQKVALSASGANSYQWSQSATGAITTVTANATTAYTVIGTGTNNCTSSAVVNLQVNNNPTVTATVSQNSLCVKETITLTAQGASSYNWVSTTTGMNMNGAVVVYQPTKGGNETFLATGIDANGCAATANVSFIVDACTGIREIAGTFGQFRAYPNPASETLHIESESGNLTEVVVSDMTGRTVMIMHPNTTAHVIDISTLSGGVYMITVRNDRGSDTVRIVKQ